MLDLNQRPLLVREQKGRFWILQVVAKPAYLSGILFYALPRVAGCCAPGGVRVVSTGRRQPSQDPRAR